jgi:hypothetical protein
VTLEITTGFKGLIFNYDDKRSGCELVEAAELRREF